MGTYSDRGAAASAGQPSPVLSVLMEEWAGQGQRKLGYMFDLNEALNRMDVERAGRPVSVNVTVPGVPGHFTGSPGSGQVAYVPDVAG